MNATNQIWQELSPHLFHLLLGLSVLCLLVGIAISMRQTAAYRGQINLYGESLPTRPVPKKTGAVKTVAQPSAAFSPASMVIGQDVQQGPAFRARSEILTPGGDSMLIRMLFACLPASHFMMVDRPLGEVIAATGALPPEMRSGAGSALENVRVGCIIAEMATLKPVGIILLDNPASREPFLDRILAAAGVPVQNIEAGKPIQIEQVGYLLREGFGIRGAGYPAMAAA